MYRPQLGSILDISSQSWGKQENRDNLIYYGINYLDQALFGLDITRGELIGIQAQEKNRKTTTLLNIVSNVAHQLRSRELWVCCDTLESGMTPTAYADALTSITAARILIAKHYGPIRADWPSVREIRGNKELKENLQISKEFLWYGEANSEQQRAIRLSRKTLSEYPITIFGPSSEEGQARSLDDTIKRWSKLYEGTFPGCEGQKHIVFTSDNLQLYYGFGSDKFGQLEQTVGTMANFIVTHPGAVVIAVSQLGKTSLINSRMTGLDAYAKGGGALAAEVNVLIETDYDKERQPDLIKIKVPRTRKKPPPDVVQEIDMESGAFLRPAYPIIANQF